MKKTLALLILSGSLVSGLKAQEPVMGDATSGKLNTWSIGAHIGHVYDLPTSIFASSEFGEDMWGLNGDDTKFDIGYGLYVEKQISPIIGLQLGYDMAEITGQNAEGEYYEGEFSNISLAGTINFSNFTVKRERSKFGFYGKLGAALNSFESQRYFVNRVTDNAGNVININTAQNADKTRLNILGGLGLRYHVSSNFRVELESIGNWVLSEDFDGDALAAAQKDGNGDMYLYTTIGAAYTFGKGRSMHEVSKNSKDYFWDSELAKKNSIDSNDVKAIVEAEVADTKADVVATKEKLAQLEADLKKQRQMLEDYKKENMKKPVVKAIQAQAFQVYFATGSDYINEEYQKVLTQLGAILKDNKDLKAVVTGFTDKRGTEKLNSKLRERRAKSVKKFLIKNVGIEKDRISTETSTQNIVGGDVYHLNRKVEIILK